MTSEDDYNDGHIESRRRGEATDFTPYYEDWWDVQWIADVQTSRDELSESAGRSAAQIIECADIDTLIDTYQTQIGVQEKVVRSDYATKLSIRCENNHPQAAPEADRLIDSATHPRVLTPGVIALMSKPDDIGWVRLIDVPRFVNQWSDGTLRPVQVWGEHDDTVNTKLLFDPNDIDAASATITKWSQEP